MKTKKPINKQVKVGKQDYPSIMPKKFSIICTGSGTTNPDEVQKH